MVPPRRRILFLACFLAALVPTAAPQQPEPGMIVFTHSPDGAEPWPVEDIYAMAPDGTNIRPLTRDGHSHTPSWSPDGKQILFIHDAALRVKAAYDEHGMDTYHPVELSTMDRSGGIRRVLRRMEPVIYSAAWSPDGRTIAVNAITDILLSAPRSTGEWVRSGLFLLQADGNGELRHPLRSAFTPAWSPDGKKLAFSLEQPRGQWILHAANADGSGDVRLTEPGWSAGEPAWSPDNKRIAYSAVRSLNGKQQIFVMNTDGTGGRQITSFSDWSCTHPSWSPDGERLVFSCASMVACGRGISDTGTPQSPCKRRIFAVNLNDPNLEPKQLSSIDGAQPAFSPVAQ